MSGNTGKKSRTATVIASILALLIIAVVILPFFIDINYFRPQIEAQLTNALGREVKVGTLKLSLLSGSISIKDIAIADNPAFSKAPFVTAKSLQIGIELKPLILSKEIRITGISLDQPAISLIQTADGKWNFSDLGSKAGSQAEAASKPSQTDILIKSLKIADGRVSMAEGQKKPSVYDKVNITVDNLSVTTSFPFTLTASMPGEGSLQLEGKAGPVNKNNTLLTPLTAQLTINHFDLVKSGLAAPDSGLSGLLNFKGTTTSDGRQVRSTGNATAEKLQLVKGGAPAGKPVALDYAVNYDLTKRTGTLQNVKVGSGKAIAQMNGAFDARGEDIVLNMKLHGAGLPVQDLKELLPAFGVLLPKGASLEGGSLDANLTAQGLLNKMITAGTAQISQTRLVGFDLSGKMALVAKLAGLKSNQQTAIEKFSTDMRLAPEGIQIGNLQLIMPELGTLSGTGTISPQQSLDFAMKAMLKPAGGPAAGLASLIKGGSLTVPFFVRGTASDPKFVPDLKNAARGLLGSALGGSSKEGQTNTGSSLGDSLRGLFKKN